MVTEAQVIELIAKQLNIDPAKVKMESTFNELGADSLLTMELLVNFEAEYDIRISEEEAANFETVGDAVKFVMKNLG